MPDDDTSIDDETELYRLVRSDNEISWDPGREQWTVSSKAFQNNTKPVKTESMSVVLGDTLEALGRPSTDANQSKPGWYIVALSGGEVRAEEQGVSRDPTTIEPAHGNVNGSKSQSRRRRFATIARWVGQPPAPPEA